MSNHQLALVVALILLAYPVFSIPKLIHSKKDTGRFFSSSKTFIPKYQGNGNNFNMRNGISFIIILLVGLFVLSLYFHD